MQYIFERLMKRKALMIGTEFILTEKQSIKANDFRKIKAVIDENADIIIKRWNEHFNK